MKDHVFWKVIAVGSVLGLFAVACGLCKNGHAPDLSFSSPAYAADVATAKDKNAEAKKPLLAFENLDCNEDIITRAKVDGGWLVKVARFNGVALTFYPDPKHEWGGGSVK